jgi:hypothetical protein
MAWFLRYEIPNKSAVNFDVQLVNVQLSGQHINGFQLKQSFTFHHEL